MVRPCPWIPDENFQRLVDGEIRIKNIAVTLTPDMLRKMIISK